MVNVNGVKNAIWVWNIERDPTLGYDYSALNPEWYPGDDVVDIVAVDIYNNSGDNSSNAKYFYKITSEVGTNKLIALSENGPIPDVDSTFEDDAVWSFWMPWYQTWSGGYLNQTSNEVWQKNLSDDRIIKLETMPGWENYTVSVPADRKLRPSAAGISLVGNELQLSLSESSTVAVFSVQGRLVQNMGQKLPGAHTVNLSNLPRGVYIVRVQGKTFALKQKISLR